MTKVALRNSLRGHISTIFRGREKIFKSKSVRIFDTDDEEQEAEMRYWLKAYGGIIYIDGNVKVGDNK